ncbi:hypothetical protein K1T71_004508 [Dendrolimus kikuchii]|uniref:Uncharacterized protein n=1 Tax=Dendrolimus kikuchii TaxID=765133 RepID=A0ACC1D918_9NEOP|nr:hypothetical protein K1T71_004508 [Dendrolimus kikuchii]
MSLRDQKEYFTSKMKLLVVVYLIAVAMAAPPPSTTNSIQDSNKAKLLKFNNDNNGLGNYKFAYEQSDGTKQEQVGEIRNKDSENPILEVKGTFTWIGPDGVSYNVTYVANEDGYKPQMEQGPGGAVPSAVLASMTG